MQNPSETILFLSFIPVVIIKNSLTREGKLHCIYRGEDVSCQTLKCKCDTKLALLLAGTLHTTHSGSGKK